MCNYIVYMNDTYNELRYLDIWWTTSSFNQFLLLLPYTELGSWENVRSLIFSMWPQIILPPNPIQKKPLYILLKHSKQDSASVAPLHKHNSVHQYDPTKATILIVHLIGRQRVFLTIWQTRDVHQRSCK